MYVLIMGRYNFERKYCIEGRGGERREREREN
jgi:hypothetical protein